MNSGWWQSKPARGLAAVMTATGASQAINLAVTPIISRLYDPQAFGVFAYVYAIVTILGVVAGLKLESAIPLADSDEEAGVILRMSLLIAVVTVAASAAIGAILVGRPFWPAELGIGWLLYIVPLGLLTYAFVSLSQAALRSKRYSTIAQRNLLQAAGTGAGQIAGGIVSDSAAGLLWGQAFGRMCALTSLVRATSDLLVGGITVPAAKSVLRKFWRFPLLFTPSAILNSVGSFLPLFLIGRWYGASAAGNLAMADRALLLPSALIGVAVGQVMIGEVSERVRSGKGGSASLYLRVSSKLAILGFTLGALCFLAAPWLFPIVLGEAWSVTGDYAQAMSLALATGFIASPLSVLFMVFQGGYHQASLDVGRVSVVGLLGWLGYSNGLGSIGCVWLMYSGMATVYVATWWIGYRLAVRSDKDA